MDAEGDGVVHVQGVAHPLPSVRAAACAALASLDQAACAALGDEELHRIWAWLQHSARGDPAAAVRAAAIKTAGHLAQLSHSLQYPGARYRNSCPGHNDVEECTRQCRAPGG